jgi:hypothetical protein
MDPADVTIPGSISAGAVGVSSRPSGLRAQWTCSSARGPAGPLPRETIGRPKCATGKSRRDRMLMTQIGQGSKREPLWA